MILSDQFDFALAECPAASESPLNGFGFTARCKSGSSFGWDWYERSSPSAASQFQDDGRLRVASHETANGWELLKSEFLTGALFRITRLERVKAAVGDQEAIQNIILDADWQIRVLCGSWIVWPVAPHDLEAVQMICRRGC